MLISCTPGPNVLYVTTRSIRFGLGAAMIGMAGCLRLAVMLSGSVAGVSAFWLAVPAAFETLKYAGAAYLIFPRHPDLARADRRSRAGPSRIAARNHKPLALFRGGFLVGISNPKLLVFAAAFFPQFIAPGALGAAIRLLVATFLAVESVFYIV